MAVKFIEITQDPFVNQSNEFILILSMVNFPNPLPDAPGSSAAVGGLIIDPFGNPAGFMWSAAYQDYEVTGTLSDEAYSHSYVHDQKTMLIPPGYTFETFGRATALQGTLEELAPFIKGMS